MNPLVKTLPAMALAAAALVAIALAAFAVQPCAAGETVLAGLLPAPDELGGWKIDGEPLSYDADNLWEYIDGSADNFLSFAFRRVIAQDYVSEAGAGLKVEIYEHESPLMAYGIYAQMRSPGLALHPIGNEAFSDEYSMSFWKNRFFVRIAVFERGDEGETALARFAAAVAENIEDGGALPPEAAAFPAEGLVPNDTRYLTEGVLGREEFPPAFVARYRLGDEEAKLYLSILPDSAAARDTLDWYLSHMTSFQTTLRKSNGGYVMTVASDPFQGDELVFQFRRYIGVLTGLEKPLESGAALVESTVEKLDTICANPAPLR